MRSYIKNFIRENGSIAFSKFIELSMYHPSKGYYITRNPIGKTGDYITAPEISSLFGRTVAVWILEQWERLEKPREIAIVELGPGSGMMMFDILNTIRNVESFYDSVTVYMIEISPFLRGVQMENLRPHSCKIRWCNSIDELPNGKVIVLANEFFDALPIDQFIFWGGTFFERKITEDFQIEEEETRKRFSGKFKDGDIVEISLLGKQIASSILTRIAKDGGSGLIVDYGHATCTRRSTIQAVKGHRFIDIFESIGESDITHEIDFSYLFPRAKLMTQGDFLSLYGIFELAKRSSATDTGILEQTLFRLVDKGKMGRLFKCAII
ncbi:class I SAM-dependent methyltransferase [Neorickettsia risticii]|uniref:ATP synthase beta subunit/transription termination factor rho n=1 Tax=Neorickettsia risticii (strain Illinois) TaxID=434131 RepID=C6V585_NEORI|nr:SAM-dependent methyltransferase [Neorickettsia risticii]ACT69561.1 ATP synthase beta subunit/transription termination factor rho [Neorickettsia risticii str. Illinois]